MTQKVCTICGQRTLTFELHTEDNQVLNFCSVECLNIWSESLVHSRSAPIIEDMRRKKISDALKSFYITTKGLKVRKKQSEGLKDYYETERGIEHKETLREQMLKNNISKRE